jgi:hypothetical protein
LSRKVIHIRIVYQLLIEKMDALFLNGIFTKNKTKSIMKALKFYDKEGTGFELFADHEKQSVMMQIDTETEGAEAQLLEFDDEDIDDIIIAFVELKNEIMAMKNISNN